MATSKQYKIDDGPSKFDLMIRLFDRSCPFRKHEFTVIDDEFDREHRLALKVDTVSVQAGIFLLQEGDSWFLSGLVFWPSEDQVRKDPEIYEADYMFFVRLYKPACFRAIYNSKTRKGRITFTDSDLIPMWESED